jgi:hypothetical protein
MNEFLAHAALIVAAATGTGLLVSGVAHYALATDPANSREAHDSDRRAARRARGE